MLHYFLFAVRAIKIRTSACALTSEKIFFDGAAAVSIVFYVRFELGEMLKMLKKRTLDGTLTDRKNCANHSFYLFFTFIDVDASNSKQQIFWLDSFAQFF